MNPIVPMPTSPGDDIVPGANMVFDRTRTIAATPEAIWPWLLQLGKRRAGWYMPRAVERFLPPGRRAIRHIDPRYTQLGIGTRIPDYGGRDAHLEVADIQAPTRLIYRDQRKGTPFSWAITLTADGDGHTDVHLRFRGRIRSTGLRRRLILAGAEFFDGLTGELMLRGLQERVADASRAASEEGRLDG